MGYKREKLQILGGGFNLLPSPDKLPKTDYLVAQNWRADRFGRLVSRYGYPQKFSIAGAGLAHSAGVHGGINGDYYVGCNSSVGSPTPSSLYWNFNPSAIATGFDGGRIGLAFLNGWCWFMNRGKQGRHQAALGAGTSQAWNLTAPGVSPTAAAAATVSTVGSVTYTFALQGNSAYVHFLIIAGQTYQIAENGYSAAQIPLVLSLLAQSDPNCTVTYSGGTSLTLTPIPTNTLIQVSASDGNAAANLANGTVTNLPNGTYQFYVTFSTADDSLESNPGPVSVPVAITQPTYSGATLTGIPTSSDARVSKRNIYVIGGSIQSAYLVTAIANNTTTSLTFSWADVDVVNAGIAMPTTNDPPPAASGVGGPYFSRLVAWSTAANPNRLFWTEPALPQYWPGSGDPAVGNWVDVGTENEAILWCTFHTNLCVIYKERSIWMFVGDFSTGYLQCVRDDIGINSAFSVTSAGTVDYFVGPGGLRLFDMDRVREDAGAAIQPLFTDSQADSILSAAPLVPGRVAAGTAYNSGSSAQYAVALGYALGKLYAGYAEGDTPTTYCLLVYHEASGRWFTHRTTLAAVSGWFGFVFDGVQMVGLSGTAGGAAVGFNLDDFRVFANVEAGGAAIACIYQSHYEDCGQPDTQKVWLEVGIDYELGGTVPANVYLGTDQGALYAQLTTLAVGVRQTASLPLAADSVLGIVLRDPGSHTQSDLLAKNLSVVITCNANGLFKIHNVYLYYYEEARLASAVSCLPSDLGTPKVKQCKELEVDLDPTGHLVEGLLSSDLPGNALALRQTLAVASQNGRALIKAPFPVTEGYIWKLALTSTAGTFRVYGARLLMRPIGVYVEAYEAGNGFVWDSQELDFDSAITKVPRVYAIALAALPIKRAREISLDIETFGGDVTVKLLTDLPGDAQAVRFTGTVNTGTAGRRFFRLPLPAGTNPPIEGRMFRLQLSGTSAFRLYGADMEILAVGVYLEAYEAAGGALFDSREQDFGMPGYKEARELELDLEADSAVTPRLITDGVSPVLNPVATVGRQKVMVPLTINAAADQFVEGRLLRLLLTSTAAFRLYGARLRVRPFGQYLSASETAGGALWDTTELDLGTQTVKQLRELELDIWAYGGYTVTVYTDLPGNVMTARLTRNQAATSGRTKVQIPLPQGQVPDNYLFGRLARVTITSTSAFKLFGARIHARPIGVYVESYEAAGGAVWDSTASDLGNPNDKTFDEVRFEMDSDGAALVAVYTDLPGEVMAQKGGLYTLTTGATGRHWATVPLPAGVEGRSIRLVVSSAAGFRIYRAQVRASRVGRYLCAATPAGSDAFTNLEFDFESQRMKPYKRIEVDLRADGQVNMSVITDQGGGLATRYSPVLATPNGRQTLTFPLPPGIRGTLLRLGLTSTNQARIYRLRVWTRPLNESAETQWSWQEYPLEASDKLPAWSDLPVPETPPQFTWADLPVEATKPEWTWAPLPVLPTPPQGQGASGADQWVWAKVLSVEETPDTWTWVDVPLEVTG